MSTDDVLPLLLTLPDTKKQLRCSISKIYDLVDQGKLDLFKLGPKSSRITSESVARLLASGGEPAAAIPNLKQFRHWKLPSRASGDYHPPRVLPGTD
jgi:hypothetical protein